jgi:hypothetical protein
MLSLIRAKSKSLFFIGWSLPQTGTDFYPPNDVRAIHWAQALYQSCRIQRYYWYDGTKLVPVSLDGLIDHLTQTLDVNFYQQQLHAASVLAAVLWKPHFYTVEERDTYVVAEEMRARAEREYQEVLQLIGMKQ